jgi:hypothetical protein
MRLGSVGPARHRCLRSATGLAASGAAAALRTTMAALRMARHRDPPFPARAERLGRIRVRRVAACCPRSARLSPHGAARPAYPGSARRLLVGPARPRYACWPGVSFPSGVATVSSLASRTCSGAPHSSTFRWAFLRRGHRLEQWQRQSRPQQVGRRPVNTQNTPPPGPEQPGKPLLDSSPPNSERRGSL